MWLRLSKLTNCQVALIFFAIGLIVFSIGLTSPFQGDDTFQIVNSAPVHSLNNIPMLLTSSTFFNGQDLVGSYYRPTMTITYAIIYTFFGPNTFFFHLVQLSLHIAGAFTLYLVLKKFFRQTLALILAGIFLIHPLNSQVVYAIPSMQDTLFFLFGMSALWVLINRKGNKNMWLVVSLLFLALISKETAIVFVLLSGLYLWLFERYRLSDYLKKVSAAIIAYSLLRVNAVGFMGIESTIAPIADATLIERLMTLPSILFFYISKFIFPWDMATRYFWVNEDFSIENVLIPLVSVVIVVGIFIHLGFIVKKKLPKKEFKAYLFFAVWAISAIMPYLQLFPLDMTACINWFYLSMAGVLGMIGISTLLIKKNKYIQPFTVVGIVLYIALAASTITQGTYFENAKTLAGHDNASSVNNYAALNDLSQIMLRDNNFKQAEVYAKQSVNIHPTLFNYQNLGVALQQQQDYSGAQMAYENALKHGSQLSVYENLAMIALLRADDTYTQKVLSRGLKEYPTSSKLWLFLAILEGAHGSEQKAKVAADKSAQYGPIPSQISIAIFTEQSYTLVLPKSSTTYLIK